MSKVKTKQYRRYTSTSWAECDCGKRGFTSRGAARRAMARASNKIRLYICPTSGAWHVTSSTEGWE